MTQAIRTETIQEKIDSAAPIRWDLSDLYSSINDPKIMSDLSTAEAMADTFETTYKGRIHTLSSSALADAYKSLETLLCRVYKLSQYVHLEYAIDTGSTEIKTLVATIDEATSKLSNRILFFDLEIGALGERAATRHISHSTLKPYHYSINRSIETAKHNLSEAEEKIINLKDITGDDALQKLYEELTSSFRFTFTLDSEEKTMNGSELRNCRLHPDPNVRRNAMALFYSRYEEHDLVLTSIFNNLIKSYAIEKDLRGYTDAIHIKNTVNDLSEAAVNTLHEVTTESYSLVQRYYKVKKRILGLDEMTLADIYAPMPESNTHYSFDEAKDSVLSSFSDFDNEIGQMAKRMFDEKRIDAPVLPAKRGGAFCSGYTPDVAPYVMLNFLGKQRDVSTLAHELGHAIHDMFCAKTQSLTNYHPILPLAETASVFSEMIVTDKLLKDAKEAKNTSGLIALLCDKLEDIFATSHRQNMFSRFEMAAHKAIESSLLSSQECGDLYMNEVRKMFGDAVTYTDEYRWEWATIPHIFQSPFYVYAYNFGNLLVMALYEQYQMEGAAFVPKYKEMLAMGSSARPVDICRSVNADIEHPEFWKKSLVYIERLLDTLEQCISDNAG